MLEKLILVMGKISKEINHIHRRLELVENVIDKKEIKRVYAQNLILRCFSNFRITNRTLVLDFKNAFKIAEKYHAEALCAEAIPYDFTKSKNWRRRCPEVRTSTGVFILSC